MCLKSIFAATCLLMAVSTGTASQKEILVASVGQFKNPKSAASQLRAGAEVYFDSVNARGGVHGAKLRLVLKDRGPDGPDTVQKVRDVIAEHKPIALIGITGTTPMEALVKANVLNETGIPLVGARTGASSLHKPVNPWVFHTRASYAQEVRRICSHLKTVGHKKVAVFYENSVFGREGFSQAQSEINAHGLHLAGTATYEYGTSNVTDAIAITTKIAPDAVIAVATSAATAEYYSKLRVAGNSAFVIALSVTDGAEVVKLIGNRGAHGLGISQVSPDPDSTKAPLVRDLREIQRKLGVSPDVVVDVDLVEGYIAARVLVEALSRAGPNATSSRLREALESMKAFNLGGYPISFSAESHSGSNYVEIAVIGPNGKMLR